MKYLFFLTPMLFLAAFTNCKRPHSASSENAIYSYSLNGKTVSGGEVDAVGINNIAMLTPASQPKTVTFFLSDGYSEKSEIFAHSLRFALPAKTGSVAFKADDDRGSVQLFLAGSDGKYAIYANDAFTVTITSISATRVSGTFSGKVKPAIGNGAIVTISDGKFDLPVRK